MAKITKKVIWWSNVPDANEYYVRVVPDKIPFAYDWEPDRVVPQTSAAEIEADLNGTTLDEGVYDIYVTSVDVAGNESDPLLLADAALDFKAPSAPSSGGFR